MRAFAPGGPRRKLNPARIILLGFLAVIFTGALLLMTPAASRGGAPADFLTALFTSTSAACVTGLVVTDTALAWSGFGQAVILLIIQIGGLGIMSISVIFYFVMRKKIGLSHRILLVKSLDLRDMQGVVRLMRHVLLGTLIFESAGAAVLWARFARTFGLWKALWLGVFHSVSAFCNAGFDLMGGVGAPFSSLAACSDDPVIIIVILLLVMIGGLGFFVWEDVWRNKGLRKLRVHSKIVLAATFWLLIIGWITLFFTERSNPGTIGGMPFGKAALASLFQAVMPRSGGFSIVDQSALTGASRMIVVMLMIIGGSSGSTSGGIKNATFCILFLSAIRSLRGKNRLVIFGRTIPPRQIITAATILTMFMTACISGTLLISLLQPEIPFSGVLFDTVSAIAICGLAHGVPQILTAFPRIILILLMFFGRVGIMTFGMAAFLNRNAEDKMKNPDSWILIG